MVVTAEDRFRRYLFYNYENNVYYPGCRFFTNRYTREAVPSLNELLADKKQDFIFDLLKQVHEENKLCYPDNLLFILSQLARDQELRPRALEFASRVCDDSRSFLTFMKFSIEYPPKIGYGRSIRKFIRNWYLNKDHLRLAEIIGENRSYRGWKHRDLIKLSHIKVTDPAKAACVKYAVVGLEEMIKAYGTVEEAKEVVAYLKTVESYKKITDSKEVAGKIDSYMLGIEHVHYSLYTDKHVWMSLMKQMPVARLLSFFQFMSKRKMFRNNRNWDFPFVDAMVEALTRPYANRKGVTPCRAFIELMNYENAPRVKQELAAKTKKTPKKPPILNNELLEGFIQLIECCLKDVNPTNKKLAIIIEASPEMVKRRCTYSRYITLIEAAGFVGYFFQHTELVPPKYFTYNSGGLKPLAVTKDTQLKQLIETLKCAENIPEKNNHGKADEALVNWIKEQSEEVDAVVILRSYMDNHSLHSYRAGNLAKKKIRFVVADLSGISKACKVPDNKSLLSLSGFDDKFLDIIQLFITGAF